MKRFLVLLVVLIVSILALSIPASAQTIASTAVSTEIPSLAIKSPLVAPVGEEVKIKVVDLENGSPAAGAGVWAVDVDRSTDLTVVSSTETDRIGDFLGFTNDDGVVTHIFQETGRYLLAAFKDGYQPAFGWLKIQPLKTMAIKGPASAYIGQTCEFTVCETNSRAVVAGAGVWAFLVTDNTTLPGTEDDLASVIQDRGIFLGLTNNLGQVYHAFTEAGPYLLLAIKSGYKPAFSKILIEEMKELVIRAPETVRVFRPVPIRVVEKSVLTVEIPVRGASVWAISTSDKASLDDVTSAEMADLVKSQGFLLGWTNKTGYVIPRPRFSQAGQYWLIAIKDGYIPGIDTITVLGLQTVTQIPKSK